MESVVQCPVCTLFLHPGMSLEDHLNTHPKDQVIQALSQLTLQRANILSGTQFSPAKSVSPSPPTTTPTQQASTTTVQQNSNGTNSISGAPNNGNEVNGNQFPCNFTTSSNNRKETALLIQVQTNPSTPVTSGPCNNKNTSARTSPQLFNQNYHESTQKNLTVVNQYVPQRIPSSSPPKRQSQSSQQVAITYAEPTTPPQQSSLIPRYTSERYSGPPPPYSTAISSTSFNNYTTVARDHYMSAGGGGISSNENSSSSYEVKAHYMEKEDGNFVVTESPQKIVEYSEDENGVLTLSEKVVKSPPRLLPYGRGEHTEDEQESENEQEERIQSVSEPVPAETLYASEPILVEKVEKMTVEAIDEVTHTTASNTTITKRKTTNGLKVLSNVKITTDMISPGLQEILLNNNRKGRRINKILNKRPQQSDLHSPSPPMMSNRSPQPSTSNTHCDDEVMDLTQASMNNAMDLHAPSTSRRHHKYEMETYVEQHYQMSDMPSEDALEQAEVMGQEDFHHEDNDEEEYEEDQRYISHEEDNEGYMSPPPLSSTPTSVIRTINDITSSFPEPTINIKSEEPLEIINSTLPPSLIMSPKPSTSSQDSHLNANHQKMTSSNKIGQPILQKPKKLTLKLKKTLPCQNTSVSNENQQEKIKVEPGLNMTQESKDEQTESDKKGNIVVQNSVKVKVEKPDISFEHGSRINAAQDEQQTLIANEDSSHKSLDIVEAGPSHASDVSSSFTITYMGGDEGGTATGVCEEVIGVGLPENNEKMQYYPIMYIPQTADANPVPLSWVQRFSPQYVPFDERSSCMEIEGSFSKNSNSVSLTSEGDTRNGQSSNSFDDRAPSADSCLNIRTDEKMPAKGEISEQESNGEIDNWNQVYQDPIQQYPSSYDVSTAQECWNLSNNKPEFMQQQQQYATFPPLQHIDGNRSALPFIPKEEKPDLDIDKVETSPATIAKPKRPRTYRCPDCVKCFTSLKQRRLHLISEHQFTEPMHFTSKPSSSNAVPEINLEAGCSSSTSHQQHMGGLSILNSDNLTGLTQIVSNFEIVKQEHQPSGFGLELEDIKPFVVMPSQINEEIFHAVRVESKKMLITYKCSTCREDFKNLKTFNKHFTIHPAECAICGKSFNRWATFALHLKRHYNIRDYQCRICQKSFILRQKLVEHMRVHTGIAPIQCNICHARFRRYSNLAQHRNRHHLNKRPYRKDYVCECGETFVSQAKLDWHRETHEDKPKVCPFCRERFVHKNSLTRHIRLSHAEKYILLKSKTVTCPYCDKKYLQTSLKAHLETHSKEKNQYSCTICSKEFSTKWNLKQHHWTHANRSSKPFQCNVCPNAFVRENDYVTHMNAHKSIRPYTCNHCGCQFVRKSNWMRHTREHEQDKNYTCELCNKKFHRAYYLTEHRRVHTGERPFSCNICGKTSATKTNHNKHIKIHHARDPLTAEG